MSTEQLAKHRLEEIAQFGFSGAITPANDVEIKAMALSLIEANKKVQALADESVKIFNMGYRRGHESTVDSYYVDIHQSDIGTYHADIVAEIIADDLPATGAAVAQVEAQARIQGINFAASHVCAAYMTGFIDKPVPEVAAVVRMILSAKAEVTSNPVPEGLSGEHAEKILSEMEAFSAELRGGE